MLHDKVTKLQFEEGGGGFRTCLLSIQESFKTQESFKIHLRVIQKILFGKCISKNLMVVSNK